MSAKGISIEPNTNVLTLEKGQTLDEVLYVTLSEDVMAAKVDVYILSDTTSSMNSSLNNIRNNANTLLTTLTGQFADIRFAVGDYADFMTQGGGAEAFQHRVNFTDNTSLVTKGFTDWGKGTSGGGDLPEGQLYGIDFVAQPSGGSIGWRSDSKKILVWFGDAPGHDPVCRDISGLPYDITEASVTQKLIDNQISVIAITVTTPNSRGLNGDPTILGTGVNPYQGVCTIGGSPNQADRIVAATGGSHFDNVQPAQLSQKIIEAVGSGGTVSTIGNLKLVASGGSQVFVNGISPEHGKGPFSLGSEQVVSFDVDFLGIKEATSTDQVFTGSIDVLVDGVKVTEKTVQVTVPKEVTVPPVTVPPVVVPPVTVPPVTVPPVTAPPVTVPPVTVPPVTVPPVTVPPVTKPPKTSGGIRIDPDTNVLTLEEEALFNEILTVSIAGETAPPRADVYFLCDSTGSMAPSINNVKDNARKLLNNLADKYPDSAFAVGNYKDFSDGASKAFVQQQSVTTDKTMAEQALNAWEASGGGDFPEAQLFAFDKIAQPSGGTVGWRRDARRIVIWFGDAPGHDFSGAVTGLSDDITQSSVIAKLKSQDIMVIGLSVDGDGLDKSVAGIKPDQGSQICHDTGGAYLTGVDPTKLCDRMEELMGKVSSNINRLRLKSTGGITPFVQWIKPKEVGPVSLAYDSSWPFDIEFKGVVPALPDRDQIFTGSIDVMADGVVVCKKTVKITVPMQVIYRYSIKYVYGKQDTSDCCELPILSPGNYRTEINIHNMQNKTATVIKQVIPLVICSVPLNRKPKCGEAKYSQSRAEDKIKLLPYHATMDDSHRLTTLLNGFDPTKNQITDGLLNIGFLQLSSTEELSVTAVYSATDLAGHTVCKETQVIPVLVQQPVKKSIR